MNIDLECKGGRWFAVCSNPLVSGFGPTAEVALRMLLSSEGVSKCCNGDFACGGTCWVCQRITEAVGHAERAGEEWKAEALAKREACLEAHADGYNQGFNDGANQAHEMWFGEIGEKGLVKTYSAGETAQETIGHVVSLIADKKQRDATHIGQLQSELIEAVNERNGLRAELDVRRHECAAQTKNALAMRESHSEAMRSIRKALGDMRQNGCTCYSEPEQGCVYCSSESRIESVITETIGLESAE